MFLNCCLPFQVEQGFQLPVDPFQAQQSFENSPVKQPQITTFVSCTAQHSDKAIKGPDMYSASKGITFSNTHRVSIFFI